MKKIELNLERQCRAYAREQGWACWKNENNGNKGIPDDSFLSPDGRRFLLVEFKASETSRIRPEQTTWRERFPTVVHIISDFPAFQRLLQG